ncbi:Low-density lipoprotein receptor-related protein 2 [Fukomys damarensis]|uniref:Low-density lipoprotein receptor-related protein 2 n=1 Tax=Fukomys damarensis TaxID=885580 RepID=A0A091E1E8_FUKDA|nr:Low-density lipoprotein receptor-related protein 2 [Fukomys damarensis]
MLRRALLLFAQVLVQLGGAGGFGSEVLSSPPKARNSHGATSSSPNADGRECNMTQQAACGDSCIPVAWLCNGEQECPDGADEHCEEPCGGHLQAWQCDDGMCIATHWLCDGAGDCLDGSDEVNCERMTACPGQKVQCPGTSECLDAWELCDVHQDCRDGSDKAHCSQSHCLAGQWQCQNKVCVMESWKCDGIDHCGDSSDEEACGRNCSLENGGCEGLCRDTAWGVLCSCGTGWQLQPDKKSCADIDECSMAYGPCDQLCHNTPGSYSCDCVQGYGLYDGSKCRITDGDVKILIATDQVLGVLDQRTGIYEGLIPIKTKPTSVAYDLERSMYFWVDKTLNVFVSGKPNSVPLYPELTTVNSIALDWFTGQLYWASSFARAICAGLSDGRGYVKILGKDVVPEQLVVFPAKKYLYWINGGGKGRRTIETAGMDGSDRKVLEVVTTQQPLGLTLDHVTGRLYWISGYKQSIETVKVDGSGRYSFPKNIEDEDPVGLAVFENSFFWANKTQLFHTSLYNQEERRVLLDASISAFSILHRSLQPLRLQSFSLLKNRTYSLNKSWSDGLMAAHTPYLMTMDKAALVLWNRKTLEPFSVLKEPHIRKMVILAENQEVPGVFRCLDGSRCIDSKNHCDGAQHCPDGSDELACWKPTEDCSLHCDEKNRCIPKSWLCDGNLDCLDKKDEEGCIPENCSTSEFRCRSGQCVSYSLRCDGNPDCWDQSDEESCPAAWPPGCPVGQVKCRGSGECVLAEWLCDHDLDCKDGSDEKDCDPEALWCSPRQWACASRDQCVPDFWHCDGQKDCMDGSDEAGCPPQKCWGYEFQCGTAICLNFSLVCDGKEDCADGSDEGGRCHLSACSPGQCPHTCYPSPAGPKVSVSSHTHQVCVCEPGFEPESIGGICEDVDECQGFGGWPCSHTCVNTKGSYICTCHPGYSLEPDGHTCKATGTEPILLVAIQFNLFLYGLRSLKEDILATIDKNLIIFSVDYDLVDQKVFWTDFNAESIHWISMDTMKRGTVVKGIKSDCIVVDWIGRNLYWTDGTAGQILAIPLTAVWRGNAEYTIVLDDDLTQPQALALDPLNGLMYWSEIGEEPQIERAGMDGSNRKILIDQGLGRPTSIALDQLSWKIFWSDDKFHSIGSANLDGTGISMLQLTQIKNPFSVTVFEDEVFWSEMKTRTVQRVQKITGKSQAVLIKRSGQPYGLKIMHEVLQPKSLNPCLDTGCSHLCLLRPRSKGSCHCPVGYLLADDGLSCVPLQESAFIFLILPTVITQIYLKNLKALPGQATLPEHRILPFTSVNQLASVDYLVQEKALYLSELNNGDIRLLRLKESGTLSWRKLISVEGSVIDLAVDWLSGNIYWIDSENPQINVASSKGQYPIVLLRENLSHPASVVLHPPAAAMCFVDLGPWDDGSHGSSIECATMDGSGRKILWQKSQVPVGLAFADSGTRLYWADSAQITKVWYSQKGVSENWWFQVDQKIVDLKVYSTVNQQGNNSCSKDNGGCSHICLPNPKGQTCRCPSGYYLADAKKCIEAVQCSVPSQSCKDGEKCISMDRVCDGHSDCPDGSDEMDSPKRPEARKSLAPEATHTLQTTTTTLGYSGRKGMRYPVRKTLTTQMPDGQSEIPEVKGRREHFHPKDPQMTKHMPCTSAFCNGRGICAVEGELRKCSCLTEHGREFCEEAQLSVSGFIALSITLGFSVVLVALGTLTYFRRVHELKRTSSRNSACDKENNQEEENLMNSEIFVNEAYDEQDESEDALYNLLFGCGHNRSKEAVSDPSFTDGGKPSELSCRTVYTWHKANLSSCIWAFDESSYASASITTAGTAFHFQSRLV